MGGASEEAKSDQPKLEDRKNNSVSNFASDFPTRGFATEKKWMPFWRRYCFCVSAPKQGLKSWCHLWAQPAQLTDASLHCVVARVEERLDLRRLHKLIQVFLAPQAWAALASVCEPQVVDKNSSLAIHNLHSATQASSPYLLIVKDADAAGMSPTAKSRGSPARATAM